MLALLTDGHLSPEIAEQVRAKRPEIVIYSLQEWHGGTLLEAEDEVILATVQTEK